jgi:hypothetical protein
LTMLSLFVIVSLIRMGGLASIKGKVGNYSKGRFPINCRQGWSI